jgi:hypothetical protein
MRLGRGEHERGSVTAVGSDGVCVVEAEEGKGDSMKGPTRPSPSPSLVSVASPLTSTDRSLQKTKADPFLSTWLAAHPSPQFPSRRVSTQSERGWDVRRRRGWMVGGRRREARLKRRKEVEKNEVKVL